MAENKSNFKELSISNPKTGRDASMVGGIIELKYYESILSNHITASLIVGDTGNAIKDGDIDKNDLLNGLPVRGGEPVRLRVLDSNGTELRFIDDYAFYVNRVKSGVQDTTRSIIVFDLCTKEFIANEQTRVQKRYSGKISESVDKILKNVLQTGNYDKSDIEPTANSYNFIGNSWKPFFVLTWLAGKSIPSDGPYGKTAGFFFYETANGFQFKSAESLISKTKGGGSADTKSIKKFQSTDTPGVKDGFKKIIEYALNKNIDVQEKLTSGAYNTRFLFFNPYSFDVKHQDFSLKDQIKANVSSAGNELDFVAEEFRKGPTRGVSFVLDVGILPSGKDAKKQLDAWKNNKDNTNDKVTDRMVQSLSRYNQLFSISVDVMIEGDFSLHAGDIIYCEFPDLAASTKNVSKETSGLYLIASLCHKITPTKTFTSMNLIRDSFGKKRA